MRNRALNLRGTNGSGKTTVARGIITASGALPDMRLGKKVQSYKGELYGLPVVVLGSYETTCGGCDTLPDVKTVAGLLDLYMRHQEPRIVFFEGLMISHMLGTVGAKITELGKHSTMLAFLDTPLDTCIQRVTSRRIERGDMRPFDPKNVVADHPRVVAARSNAMTQGYRVVDVNHTDAFNQTMRLLNNLAQEIVMEGVP